MGRRVARRRRRRGKPRPLCLLAAWSHDRKRGEVCYVSTALVQNTSGSPIKPLTSGFYKRGGFMWNTRFSIAVTLIVLANLGGIGRLSAQVVTNGSYYEENKSAACGAGECVIEFTPTPSSPRVSFTKVNCLFASMSGGVLSLLFGVRDTSGGTVRRYEYLPISNSLVSQGGLRYYSSLAPTDMLFAPGKIPVLRGLTDGAVSGSLICKITGRLEQQ
jgi:hypothetical protein